MTDPAIQLVTLRALRNTVADTAQLAALDALIASLETVTAPPTQTITGNAQVGVAVAGDIRGNVYLDGQRADAAARLLSAYLTRLRARCGAIPLEGMRQQNQVGDVFQIGLDQIYTQLSVPGSAPRESFTGAELRTLDIQVYIAQYTGDNLLPTQRRIYLRRPTTLDEHAEARQRAEEMAPPDLVLTGAGDPKAGWHEELLADIDPNVFRKLAHTLDQVTFYGPRLVTDAIADTSQLVLLGEPGSGKSTVLRYLALTLAEAGLDQSVDLAARLAGWEQLGPQQRLLPIFLPLLPFARQLAGERPHQAGADDLWCYIADQLEPGDVRTGLAEAVHAELAAGRVLLLLDGLDEVASADSRRQVVGAVVQFAREHAQCRMVVSCRVRAYEGEQNAAWQLPGWTTTTLEPWDHAQMHHFVAAWYAAAVAAGGLPEAQRASRVAALQRAITASADLQRLATRPLLLTIMALVHLNDGRLPENRVALYGRCVDILLGQWELRGKETSDYGALMNYLGLPDRDVQRLRPLLARAAFKAHQAGSADSPGVLGRETLRGMVADHLEQLGHVDPHRAAQKFLEYTDQRAGLLQASDAGDAYVFPHLTFQEYLAGLELTSGVGVVQRIMSHRENDRWRVPILLGIGDYVSGNKLEMPYQLLRELLDAEDRDPARQARDIIFAAEIAADVGWDRLEQGGATFKRLRRDLAQALAPVVEGTILPARERVRAGELLGAIGDPRLGVCTLPPAMVQIAGGSFVIGETHKTKKHDNELNDQQVFLVPFELARYPVTNAQYELFLSDDGYNPERPWWDKNGQNWLKQDIHKERRKWQHKHSARSYPNYPVVDVTWYEAIAFCRWLSQHSTYNADHYHYTLPSEAEWEYAARGAMRRMYPWGDTQPEAEYANYDVIFGGSTVVGSFSAGATPEGLLDMAGNVWEWTRSDYRPYPYDPKDGREDLNNSADKHYIFRGGSWVNPAKLLRAADRSNRIPNYQVSYLGFRLVRYFSEMYDIAD
jgi:formylglycine-generating enzyme required for sulfatase activity/energy-coupling factor transporter ATP-binding protein EcfA2